MTRIPRRAGVHDFVIMSITGHTTFEMFKRYNKVDRTDLKNGINSMMKMTNDGKAELPKHHNGIRR